MQARSRENSAVCQRELEFEAQPARLQSQVGIEINNQALSHLAHHLECGVFTFLTEHSLEDLEETDSRNDQPLNGENSWLERAGIWSIVDVLEPAGRIHYVGGGAG